MKYKLQEGNRSLRIHYYVEDYQTWISAGDCENIWCKPELIDKSELEKEQEDYYLKIKILNSIGSLVNLTNLEKPSAEEIETSKQILDIDNEWNNQRNRKVHQAVKMVCRHRFAARGFYDIEIDRYVEATGLEEAAVGLDMRHRLACGWSFDYEKPYISKKTLDDYQHQMDLAKPFDFEKQKNQKISTLRAIATKESKRRQ